MTTPEGSWTYFPASQEFAYVVRGRAVYAEPIGRLCTPGQALDLWRHLKNKFGADVAGEALDALDELLDFWCSGFCPGGTNGRIDAVAEVGRNEARKIRAAGAVPFRGRGSAA